MEKLKFFVRSENELNEYEREHKKISYATLVKYLFSDMILCNNITNIFYADINGEYVEPFTEIGQDYNEETDEYIDIYQYFIVNFANSCCYDLAKKYLNDDIILYYIEKLDIYVLGVDHFGTGWDYVLTDIEYTTEYENSIQGKLYE